MPLRAIEHEGHLYVCNLVTGHCAEIIFNYTNEPFFFSMCAPEVANRIFYLLEAQNAA